MLFDNHASPTPPENSDSDFALTKAKLNALLLNKQLTVEFEKLTKSAKKARTHKGFKWVSRCTVKFSKICEKATDNDGNGNSFCRVNGISKPNVLNIKESFEAGVNYTSYVPILKFKINKVKGVGGVETGETTEYELLGGHHRLEALKELGFTEWVFDVYQYDPTNSDGTNGKTMSEYESHKTAQMKDNDHEPAGRSTIADVVKTTLAVLADDASTSIEKTPNGQFVPDSLTNYIKSIATTMNSRDRKTAFRTILHEQNTKAKSSTNGKVSAVAAKFFPYSASSAENFLTKTKGDWKAGGNLDVVRDMHGYTMADNNTMAPIWNAMFKVVSSVKDDKGNIDWNKTPKECYLIVHADTEPTETKPYDATIAKVCGSVKKWEEAVLYLADYIHKYGKSPINIVGRLPQIADLDNFDEMIPITSKKFKTKK
jgi:hypothetical protein